MAKKAAAKRGPKKSCEKKTTKKYAQRDSPPYPGSECCGQVKKGNDGKMWESRKAVDGSCRWHRMTTRSQKTTGSDGGCG